MTDRKYYKKGGAKHERMCLAKFKFLSLNRAEAAAKNLRQKQNESPDELRPYRCPAGNHYHVGHTTLASLEIVKEEILIEQELGDPPEASPITAEEMVSWAASARSQLND